MRRRLKCSYWTQWETLIVISHSCPLGILCFSVVSAVTSTYQIEGVWRLQTEPCTLVIILIKLFISLLAEFPKPTWIIYVNFTKIIISWKCILFLNRNNGILLLIWSFSPNIVWANISGMENVLSEISPSVPVMHYVYIKK